MLILPLEFELVARVERHSRGSAQSSTPSCLVPERLAGLQRVLDSLERLPLAEEAQESFAFEVQQILLADRGRMRHVAAREDGGDLPPDQRVVLGRAARTPCEMHAQLES